MNTVTCFAFKYLSCRLTFFLYTYIRDLELRFSFLYSFHNSIFCVQLVSIQNKYLYARSTDYSLGAANWYFAHVFWHFILQFFANKPSKEMIG